VTSSINQPINQCDETVSGTSQSAGATKHSVDECLIGLLVTFSFGKHCVNKGFRVVRVRVRLFNTCFNKIIFVMKALRQKYLVTLFNTCFIKLTNFLFCETCIAS
jgi:hypothetical protein